MKTKTSTVNQHDNKSLQKTKVSMQRDEEQRTAKRVQRQSNKTNAGTESPKETKSIISDLTKQKGRK